MEQAEQNGDRTKARVGHNCNCYTSDARTAQAVNEVPHEWVSEVEGRLQRGKWTWHLTSPVIRL